MTNSAGNAHLGTPLDDFLTEDGLLESTASTAASRTFAWQEDRSRRSLWQVAQFGYDIFVFQDDGPLVPVTDENADAFGVYATEHDSDAREIVLERVYLNFEPRGEPRTSTWSTATPQIPTACRQSCASTAEAPAEILFT